MTTSMSLTILGCLSSFNIFISRVTVGGNCKGHNNMTCMMQAFSYQPMMGT